MFNFPLGLVTPVAISPAPTARRNHAGGAFNVDYRTKRLRQVLEAQEVSITPADPDQTLDLGAGANLQVLVAGKRGVTIPKSNIMSQLFG